MLAWVLCVEVRNKVRFFFVFCSLFYVAVHLINSFVPSRVVVRGGAVARDRLNTRIIYNTTRVGTCEPLWRPPVHILRFILLLFRRLYSGFPSPCTAKGGKGLMNKILTNAGRRRGYHAMCL